MAYGFVFDQVGSKCSGKVQPGALALAQYAQARWSLPLIGTYNCRPPAGSSSGLSVHAEGRADDLHVHTRAREAPPTPEEKAVGDAIFAFLIFFASALGVQRVIWLDLQWDSRTRRVSHYTGPFHGNHVHVELCWAAALSLTLAVLHTLDPINAPPEDDMYLDMAVAVDANGDVWKLRIEPFTHLIQAVHPKANGGAWFVLDPDHRFLSLAATGPMRDPNHPTPVVLVIATVEAGLGVAANVLYLEKPASGWFPVG